MSNDSSSSVGPLASAIEAALMELLRLDPGTASIRIAPTAGGSVVVLQQAEGSGEASTGVGRDSPTSIGSGDSSSESRTDVDEAEDHHTAAAAAAAGRLGADRSSNDRRHRADDTGRHASSHGQREADAAAGAGPGAGSSGGSGYTGRSWRSGWRFSRPTAQSQSQYGGYGNPDTGSPDFDLDIAGAAGAGGSDIWSRLAAASGGQHAWGSGSGSPAGAQAASSGAVGSATSSSQGQGQDGVYSAAVRLKEHEQGAAWLAGSGCGVYGFGADGVWQ